MWFWSHLSWLFLVVPFAMMLACVIMCVVMSRSCGCRVGCCGHMHGDEHQGKPSS